MKDYTAFDLNTLTDMLSEHTEKYLIMVHEGSKTEEEFSQCQSEIHLIQEAILKKRLSGQKVIPPASAKEEIDTITPIN